jgi:hypothetical protein
MSSMIPEFTVGRKLRMRPTEDQVAREMARLDGTSVSAYIRRLIAEDVQRRRATADEQQADAAPVGVD